MSPETKLEIENYLNQKIEDAYSLGGGTFFPTYCLRIENKEYFIKIADTNVQSGFVEEVESLFIIKNSNTLSVPNVLGYNKKFLILELIIDEAKTPEFWTKLGTQLALMHKNTPKQDWGFMTNNFIGPTAQINTKRSWPLFSWANYFLEFRLDHLAKEFFNDINFYQLYKAARPVMMHELAKVSEGPCLVHGDLWEGNILCGPDQTPYVIDPACYFGHREVDMAMTELFGPFDEAFYQSYHKTYPLQQGYEKRRDIYNLYHLLNHWKLFGEIYRRKSFAVLEEISIY